MHIYLEFSKKVSNCSKCGKVSSCKWDDSEIVLVSVVEVLLFVVVSDVVATTGIKCSVSNSEVVEGSASKSDWAGSKNSLKSCWTPVVKVKQLLKPEFEKKTL